MAIWRLETPVNPGKPSITQDKSITARIPPAARRQTNSLSRLYRPMTSLLVEYATLSHGMQNIARCRIRRESAARSAAGAFSADYVPQSIVSKFLASKHMSTAYLQPQAWLRLDHAKNFVHGSCTGMLSVRCIARHQTCQPTTYCKCKLLLLLLNWVKLIETLHVTAVSRNCILW